MGCTSFRCLCFWCTVLARDAEEPARLDIRRLWLVGIRCLKNEADLDKACCSFECMRLVNYLANASLDLIQAMLLQGNVLANGMNAGASWSFLGESALSVDRTQVSQVATVFVDVSFRDDHEAGAKPGTSQE